VIAKAFISTNTPNQLLLLLWHRVTCLQGLALYKVGFPGVVAKALISTNTSN
jgi:hypothetical protein